MKKIQILFYLICTIFLLVSCSSSHPKTETASTDIPTAVNTLQPSSTPTPDLSPSPVDTEATPTPTPTPTLTATPSLTSTFKPGANTYGPYVFGSNQYYIYIESTLSGSEIALLDVNDGSKVFSGQHMGMLNIELTLLTASIIDLNFDNIPDFSFIKDNMGTRDCWLASGTIDAEGNINVTSYTYNKILSSIPALSRCFESSTLYGFDYNGSSSMVGYKYQSDNKTIVKSEELTETFIWNIEKIAAALAGSDTSIEESENVIIRRCECTTVTVGGYLTIARDSYGRYYIKDMPMDGFYRLSLNPNGNWSKSEKVTNQ